MTVETRLRSGETLVANMVRRLPNGVALRIGVSRKEMQSETLFDLAEYE